MRRIVRAILTTACTCGRRSAMWLPRAPGHLILQCVQWMQDKVLRHGLGQSRRWHGTVRNWAALLLRRALQRLL